MRFISVYSKIISRMARHSGGIFTSFALLVAFISCACVLGVAPKRAEAAINTEINFQGKLTNPDGTNVTNGTVSIDFSIYTVPVAGTAVWTETQPAVTVTDGIFNVALGSVSALPGSVDFNSNSLYLGVKVGADLEMAPRIKFTAAPYAHNSDNLDGLDSSAFSQLSGTNTFTGANTFQPTTDITGLTVKQNSFATPTADIFNVQTANSTTVMQVTGPAINEAAVTLQSVGSTRALTLTSQAAATWSTASGTLTVQGGTGITMASAAQTLVGSGTVTMQSGATSVTASSHSGDINLTTGNATAATSNSGSIALNVGSATGTRGSIAIGTGAVAPSGISIGQATVTTTGILGAIINIGTVAADTAGSTIHIADTSNATGIQAVTIGSAAANASNAVTLNSGATTQANTNAGVNIRTSTNSTTALQVQNSSSVAVLAVDTSATVANNLITTLTTNGTPSFEAASTTGWTGVNGCTLSSVTSAGSNPVGSVPYSGTYGGQCVNTASANAQFRYVTGALTPSTVYTLSFYAKSSATSGTVLNFGHRENGGAEDVANLSLTGQYVGTSGWTRYSLTFRTGGTLAAGDYLYIKQSDATARTLWIDGVTFQTDSNADGNYAEGAVTTSAVVNSALVLQNAANSTTAFQVENASGAAVFTVDTTDSNLVSNPGAEINAVGWSAKGAATAPIRDTSQAKYGAASFKIVTTAALNDGVQFALSPSLPIGTYSIGFSVKNSGTAWTANNMVAGLTNGGGDTSCVLSPAVSTTVPSTTAWTRFTCSVTIAGTAATAFYVKQSEAVIHTFWIDGIELDSGTTSLPYGLGSVSLNGVVNSPAIFKNQADSNQALAVYDSSSVQLFAVNSADDVVHIGSSVTDTNQVTLQLDSFDTFSEVITCSTTANQGGIYYNTQSHAVRGCVNGAWEDMVSTAGLGMQLFGVVTDSGVAPGDLSSVTDANNIGGPCKVYVGALATTTAWNACTAYSGGRKVIVAAGSIVGTNAGAGNYQHLCLTGANSQPALSVAGAETANLATVSLPSVVAPILCLADIRYNAANNTITQVYDTRTFTTTDKTPITVTTNTPVLGALLQFTNAKGTAIPMATLNGNNLAGVVVATTGATSATTVNAIMATGGPAAVKAITGTNAVNAYIFGSGTFGRARTVATKPAETTATIYNVLGNARTAWTGASACANNTDSCQGSIMTEIDKR